MMYASLIGPLMGCYYPLPFQSEAKNRVALNSSKLSRLWCSVYSEKEVDAQIARWGGVKLPTSLELDYDSYEVNKVE